MLETASPSLPFWDQCVQELKVRRSRFRIRRHPGSPFIYVREMVAGRKLGEFSLKPKRWCIRDDIEEARDLCIQGHTVEGRPAGNAKDLFDQRSFWRRGLATCEASQPGG
ncbi:hypothetical protein [Vulcanococcus sp. Clear-D1]|uniref:hypothetical protein n=1 Tax=Vulcanococcus sp. Clear-D1 TaxID=2766970 RepID=UPI0019BF1E49|nr:hypothetical protein [Vulcanococcus sp. Clear-D1]MBD1193636.1 hypothetical protein [Vulcanococcus sp. Clear-D1]